MMKLHIATKIVQMLVMVACCSHCTAKKKETLVYFREFARRSDDSNITHRLRIKDRIQDGRGVRTISTHNGNKTLHVQQHNINSTTLKNIREQVAVKWPHLMSSDAPSSGLNQVNRHTWTPIKRHQGRPSIATFTQPKAEQPQRVISDHASSANREVIKSMLNTQKPDADDKQVTWMDIEKNLNSTTAKASTSIEEEDQPGWSPSGELPSRQHLEEIVGKVQDAAPSSPEPTPSIRQRHTFPAMWSSSDRISQLTTPPPIQRNRLPVRHLRKPITVHVDQVAGRVTVYFRDKQAIQYLDDSIVRAVLAIADWLKQDRIKRMQTMYG